MTEQKQAGLRAFLFSRMGVVLVGFLAIAGYFLWQEHAVHIQGYLPLILILALCGGMHFFMHRGHGRHDMHGDASGGWDASAPNVADDERDGDRR